VAGYGVTVNPSRLRHSAHARAKGAAAETVSSD